MDFRTRRQHATRGTFFISGFGMAAWAPLVPFVKLRAQLNDGSLGILLLCFGIGSVVSMPFAGLLASRWGCRPVLIGSSLLIALALPLLALGADPVALGVTLLLFGVGIGSSDCVANIQAVRVEQDSGRTLMSGFHGMFSLGGMLGAGGMSAMLSVGAPPLAASACIAAIIIAVMLNCAPYLLTRGSEPSQALTTPDALVLIIGVMAFVVFLTEGAALDWSAVFLSSQRGMALASAGIGYAAFAATMTAGRLTGDLVVRRFGGIAVIVGGALCAATGLLLATQTTTWRAATLGFALVGTGCANIVPVLYSAVGRQTKTANHVAVAVTTSMGYAGILVGPALIGFSAQHFSLGAALVGVSGLLIGVAAGAFLVRPEQP